ncbi:auxin-responsive protein IAA32-like isoform X5 [Nymphaea colorata]|uniref:auxin-responsive protein IAA32-like isoform X5 n=1 Tax=Nymphaea colorata TaxID=210225 RepID=UPI00129D5125|nr:auxin-responsive protein IAA32-like isoform X5 [Nymphaea colorata]
MLPSVSGYGGNEATIDLGLSLGSWLQQEANAPQQALQKKASMVNLEVGIEEEAGKQSTRGSGFVKVNMDEIGIGRKICVMDYAGYAGLALELEKMFGTHSPSGLRLLDQDSSFSLVYKDRNTGDWMPISNFSWQEFVQNAMRLRIMRK